MSKSWIVTLIAFLLVSCGGAPDETGVTLNRGLVGEPDTLDPQKNSTVQGHRVQLDLFEGLLRHAPDGHLENGVATNWSVTDDGLLYTFELDPKAKWSNGDPVVADDFVFSFQRLVSPETAAFYAGFVSTIANASDILTGNRSPDTLGIKAVDDHTLTIQLSEPTAYFPQLLTHPATFPLHRPSVEEFGDRYIRAGNLISNGAYILDNVVPGSSISLKRNLNYRENDKVAIDAVNYLVVVSGDSMYNQYRAGELLITGTVPTTHFEEIAENRPDELKVAPQLGLYYYGLNLKREPFGNNKKLRQALSIVLDRELLVKGVTRRGEVAAYTWVPPGIAGYEPPIVAYSSMTSEERLVEGRRLYAEAGFSDENPARFELRYNIGEGEQRIAIAVQSMWREKLGAEAELVNEEYKVLISNIQQMVITEMYRLSWIGDYFDPQTFLQLMETANPSNLTGYSNPEFDRLMALAATELDSEKRMAIFREAEGLMLDDQPAIPLYYYVSKHLVHPSVKGWTNSIVDFHPTRHLRLETSGDE